MRLLQMIVMMVTGVGLITLIGIPAYVIYKGSQE